MFSFPSAISFIPPLTLHGLFSRFSRIPAAIFHRLDFARVPISAIFLKLFRALGSCWPISRFRKNFIHFPLKFCSNVNFHSFDLIGRNTLPRNGCDADSREANVYSSATCQYPHGPSGGISNSRSSWAGIPSTSSAALSVHNSNISINSSNNNSNTSGSTLTLTVERREDTATPIVQEGKIR